MKCKSVLNNKSEDTTLNLDSQHWKDVLSNVRLRKVMKIDGALLVFVMGKQGAALE